MPNGSGQRFLGRNRAPRVQIEYDVETYDSNKKVQLPFVVGVMADLAGSQVEPPAKLEDRKFLEFDHDNFNNRMRAMKPRVATSVANKLTGQGSMAIDLVFTSLYDFSPTAIANNVEPLRKLLDARKRLANLIAYMDGRGEAETLLAAALKDPRKLCELASSLGASAAEITEAPSDTKAQDENGKSE